MQIVYEENPDNNDIQILTQGIIDYAKEQRDHKSMEPFAFFIRGEAGQIRGGCNGNIGYDWVYIDQLWVDKAFRGKGYGASLMHAAEELGKQKNCISAAVNTMDWEAPEFYKKLGYRIEFERHGLAKNSVFYYLRKELL